MRLRRGCRGWWIALLAALLDRLTKLWVESAGRRGALVPGLLNLRPVENRGMAFSMLSGQAFALSILTAVLIAGLVGWLVARPDVPKLIRAGAWLIVGGGLGNLYDRLASGGVTDFLELAFVRFAVFNVADVCICIGAALVVVGAWMGERKRGTGNREQE